MEDHNPHWVVKALMSWHFDIFEKLNSYNKEINYGAKIIKLEKDSIYADYYFSGLTGWNFSQLELNQKVCVEKKHYRFISELEEELEKRAVELYSEVKRIILKDTTIYWIENENV